MNINKKRRTIKSGDTDFDTLVKFLIDNGYTVEVEKDTEYDYYSAEVTGYKIKGCFCTPNRTTYWCLNGRFCFDRKDCFDKWSKCPYTLSIPTTDIERAYILDRLKFLNTKEGDEFASAIRPQEEYYNISRAFRKRVLNPKKGRKKKVKFTSDNLPHGYYLGI